MEDLFQFLLAGSETGAHLLSLSAQLCLGLQLFGQHVLLFDHLLVLALHVLGGTHLFVQLVAHLAQFVFLLRELFLLLRHLEQRLHLGVKAPPLPVAQLEVGGAVALNDANGVQLLDTFLEHTAGETAAAVGLEVDNQVGNLEIALLFQVSEDTGAEKDLGLTDAVQVGIEFEREDHFLACLLAIHEALGDHVGCEELVALTELLEGNAVGESLATDADAFKYTVAAELIENKSGIDLTSSLLVIRDDTTNKVRVRVAQSGHKLRQLFLVELRHGSEHTLAGARAKLRVRHGLLSHANDFRVLPNLHDKGVLRRLEQFNNVLVERVHVLHEPLGGRVIHFAGVVDDGKVSHAAEVRLHEFGMARVRVEQLLDEALVGRLGEPALFVEQSHDTHGFLNQVNCGLQIQSEIDKLPLDTFALVLFLFQDEHGVVEELLQLLVSEVDAHLLKRIELKDFKTGHIENADERGSLALGAIQRAVDARHQPTEHAFVAGLRNGFHGELNLSSIIEEINTKSSLRLESKEIRTCSLVWALVT